MHSFLSLNGLFSASVIPLTVHLQASQDASLARIISPQSAVPRQACAAQVCNYSIAKSLPKGDRDGGDCLRWYAPSQEPTESNN